ncbi:MAG: BatD family protein, partial [Planctomycetota bacterium]
RWIVKAQVKDAVFDVPVFKSDDFYIEDPPEVRGAYAKTEVSMHGVPVVVAETREVIKGMEAAVISFSKILIPKRPGRITLDPVTVSTNMATGRVRTNEIFNPIRMKYERFSVQSDSIELDVLPLPEAGRPAAFYGLAGLYTISAQASPTQVSVGDPITLTLRVGGNPYLKPVQWPDLETVLGDDFKIPSEKASPVIDKGQKVFTQTIRANNDSVTEIPPIPLAYFDAKTGDYAVARTEPIKLEVAATKVLTERDVEGTSPRAVGRAVEALPEGFSTNYYGPEVLVDQTFSPLSAIVSPGYALLWSVPLLGLLACTVFKLSTRTSPEAVAKKRRRRACSLATQRLNKVASADSGQRHDLLVSALRGYLGEKFDRTAGSLTADDCREIVSARTGDVEIADRFGARISELEATRYASMNAQVDAAQIEEAIELVRLVERKAR